LQGGKRAGKNGKRLWLVAEKLKNSQGFYTRLYNRLCELTVEEWGELEAELPDFSDDFDVIMYLEG
jgi:hypothetical protein